MERRQNERHTANYSAEVRYRSGQKMQLPVLDIGLGGCMVDARSWGVRPGESIFVRLPGLASQPATVIWIEDERAGIAFEELLYEPTLEHLNRLAA
ncbi:MAG: PilZ domain-containing protein [Alphaproteobacteria bacterium]|nr:MAG: PilZ domain-containing protein [Alphaproteobacteria bacterium]